MSARPGIVGIVNVTTDSFSDGGRYLDADAALAHARALVDAGADVIELGPASSHPDAQAVGADEEIARMAGILDSLVADGVCVSVDSWQPAVQRHALAAGAAWLNDICGFPDASVYAELASSSAKLVVMHSVVGRARADRGERSAADVVAAIDAFFDARIDALERAGVDRDRLILDPGMGFFLGSNPEPSLAVLAGLPRLRERYGLPVPVSVSVVSRALGGAGPPSGWVT